MTIFFDFVRYTLKTEDVVCIMTCFSVRCHKKSVAKFGYEKYYRYFCHTKLNIMAYKDYGQYCRNKLENTA